jgi:hypothetical protein
MLFFYTFCTLSLHFPYTLSTILLRFFCTLYVHFPYTLSTHFLHFTFTTTLVLHFFVHFFVHFLYTFPTLFLHLSYTFTMLFCTLSLHFLFTLLVPRLHLHWNAKRMNHSTQDSRVVPHHGTNWAALCLTAQIRRDAVLSKSYGRGY